MKIAHCLFAGLILTVFTSSAMATNHALIVGVTEYPNLENRDLEGPANDAGLVKEVLLQRGFDASKISELSERAEADGKPVRVNIIERLEWLASNVKKDDFVYLHFGGHGTRQPAKEGDFTETDGLDEIFLPADAANWNRGFSSVENAIVDDEIGEFLDRIRGKGADVWIVFDSCHSGTMTRGGGFGDIRYRKINPSELGIPEASVRSRGQQGQEENAGFLDDPGSENAEDRGYLVEFFAAQSTQTTPEMPLPRNGENRKAYGIFTYQLMSALARSRGISYNQLGHQILAQYRALPWRNSQPLIQGAGDAPLDQPVFDEESTGVQVWPASRESAADTISVGAGQLQSFNSGSIVKLYSDAIASDDSLLGRAEIVEARPVSSLARVLDAGADMDLPKKLYAVLEKANADFTLSVAPLAAKGMSTEEKSRLQDVVSEAAEENPLLLAWSDDNVADLRVTLFEDRAWFLLPDQSLPCDKQDLSSVELEQCEQIRTPQELLFVAFPQTNKTLAEVIKDGLNRIARVENLVRLQDRAMTGNAPSTSPLEVSISYTRGGEQSSFPLGTVPVFRTGDILHMRIRNTSRSPQDVGVLYRDALYGVTDLARAYKINSRLMSGESIDLPAMEINPSPEGREDFIILSRPGTDVNQGFIDLEQPPLGVALRGAPLGRASTDMGSMQIFPLEVRK